MQAMFGGEKQHAHHLGPYLGQLGQQVRVLSHHIRGQVIQAALGLAI